MVAHYAWASELGSRSSSNNNITKTSSTDSATDNTTDSNGHGTPEVNIRFILSGSSSYLYLDNRRPHPSCLELYDEGASLACESFELPDNETLRSCGDYDIWKYGVDGFPRTGYLYLEGLGRSDEV